MKHTCSRPDCDRRFSLKDDNTRTGKCAKHGKWYACAEHAGITPFRNHPYYGKCPLCVWLTPEEQDRVEAAKRNAAGIDRVMAEYIAGYRARGYGETAAKALAEKRFSQDDNPPRRWRDSDIRLERSAAKFRQEARAGKFMRCTVCGNSAPASDGIILEHAARTDNDGYTYPCNAGFGTAGEVIEFSD